jgi:hypothetical protein
LNLSGKPSKLTGSKGTIHPGQWESCEIIFGAIRFVCLLKLAIWDAEPSQYTPETFLEKHDFLVANSVFGYLSLAFTIQKKGEPSSLTKRQKEQSRTRVLVPD